MHLKKTYPLFAIGTATKVLFKDTTCQNGAGVNDLPPLQASNLEHDARRVIFKPPDLMAHRGKIPYSRLAIRYSQTMAAKGTSAYLCGPVPGNVPDDGKVEPILMILEPLESLLDPLHTPKNNFHPHCWQKESLGSSRCTNLPSRFLAHLPSLAVLLSVKIIKLRDYERTHFLLLSVGLWRPQ
jgi:hypothetical protein